MGLANFIKPTTLTFVGREHIVGDTYSFVFEPATELTWRAGQHGLVEVKLPSGKTARRMFSLSSAPSERRVTITTHWLGEGASEYKKALWMLKPGDKASVRGPVGPMYLRDYRADNVFIAGGIGITPFYAILKESVLRKNDLHTTLLYANKNSENAVFKAELDKLQAHLSHLHVRYVTSPESVTARQIEQASKDIHNAMYYLSGSPGMVRSYKKLLKSMGISGRSIKSDPFMGYK